ncbi:hypothetical protein MAPG_03389 [Magnaporthiopsis poae ATCC 64411]|uniref:Uncharacterized protein n=1 Tax=Magnaporthiopsis poae (strain ATCC 64411 / 73-15) TaxID=644358 RepID=A0A0C4DTW2_MAGP6|nr:hypothetical protein MAPG_03389 [Magnaporthiopsis poae ATCC 64411]
MKFLRAEVGSDLWFDGLETLKPLLQSPIDEFWLDFEDKAAPVPALIRILPRGGPFTVRGVGTEGDEQRLSSGGLGSAQISAFRLAAVNDNEGVKRWLCEDTEPDEDTASFRSPSRTPANGLSRIAQCMIRLHHWGIVQWKSDLHKPQLMFRLKELAPGYDFHDIIGYEYCSWFIPDKEYLTVLTLMSIRTGKWHSPSQALPSAFGAARHIKYMSSTIPYEHLACIENEGDIKRGRIRVLR